MKIRCLIILLILNISCFVSFGQEKKIVLNYPEIEELENTQTVFGMKINDRFSALNELDHRQVQDWFKAQDSLAEAYFSDDPNMIKFLEKFEQLQDIQKGRISLIHRNELGNYFYLKYDDSSMVDKLYYRKDLSSPEIELFDPSTFAEQKVNISYLNPSFDGQKIAIGYKIADQDFASQVLILNVLEKKFLNDEISNINPDFGGIEWLPDSSGFIYLYFPIVDKELPGYKKNSFSVIHFLGNNPEERNFIFGNEVSVNIPSDFYPKVKIGSSVDEYIIGYAATSSDYYDAYITKIADILNRDPKWKPFFKEAQKVFYTQGEVRNQNFIFRQGNDSGNLISIVDINIPDFNNPMILARGTKEDPITQLKVTKDKVYFSRSKFGVEVSIFELEEKNNIKELQTPFNAGFVSFFGANVAGNFIGAELDGWTSDYTRYVIDPEGVFKTENLKDEVEYPGFENLVSEQIMVKSHDGVEVPLSLVYNKKFQFDGEREIFIYVYGAYGESLSPFFYPIFLEWVMQGGVLAFPHVRGGGEKGKDWHIQGMKNLKYNSWKDLIACTEELINRGITRKGLISLYTTSAGGITAGMAVNERPDLYSSFIAEVPRLHPFGLESSSTASSTSYLEYGTIKDSIEVQGLIKMDPYINIQPATNYPATLIMPSYNDDRIPLWDSGKYIAKLQKNNIANTPLLLDIDYKSGHGNLSGYDETIILYSKIFSFAKSNMRSYK